jgi:hypothetical protein
MSESRVALIIIAIICLGLSIYFAVQPSYTWDGHKHLTDQMNDRETAFGYFSVKYTKEYGQISSVLFGTFVVAIVVAVFGIKDSKAKPNI